MGALSFALKCGCRGMCQAAFPGLIRSGEGASHVSGNFLRPADIIGTFLCSPASTEYVLVPRIYV